MTDQSKTADGHGAPARRGSLSLALIPLGVFVALVLVFYFGLFRGDPSHIPSALIGKPAPEFKLEPLEGLVDGADPVPGLSTNDLRDGRVSVVNVWASWCGPCRLEHPMLLQLAEDDTINVVGINYKDQTVNARRFLGFLGNPYTAVGVDDTGGAAIDWGVHGVPETFIVDGKGIVRYKHIGPISQSALENTILPEILKAKAE